jgi:hypothetical protein
VHHRIPASCSPENLVSFIFGSFYLIEYVTPHEPEVSNIEFQLVITSDDWVKSDCQKTAVAKMPKNGLKLQFFSHNFLTVHRNWLLIAALDSG